MNFILIMIGQENRKNKYGRLLPFNKQTVKRLPEWKIHLEVKKYSN